MFSDSKHTVDGYNKWLSNWIIDGWTRNGKMIKNVGLWQTLNRVLIEYTIKGFDVHIKYVPAHVGIRGNERADRLAKAAADKARRNSNLSDSQLRSRWVEDQADNIVNAILANM